MDTYPDVVVRAVNLDMPVPSVIALREYAPTGKAVSLILLILYQLPCLTIGHSTSYHAHSCCCYNDILTRIAQRPAFTRRNVFLRDGYMCQYCRGRFRTSDLSLDHVEPRCMGGKLNWYVCC